MRDSTVRGPAIDLSEFERRLRAGEPARKSAGDPLSELARLVNPAEKPPAAERYNQVFSPQVAAQRGDLANWVEQSGRGHAPPPLKPSASATPRVDEDAFAAALRGSFEGDNSAPAHSAYTAPPIPPHQLRPAAPEPVFDGHHQGEPTSDWNEDQRYLDYGVEASNDEADPDETRRAPGFLSKIKPWYAVVSIGVLAAASIGAGFAYRSGSMGPREIATINAPEGPSKVQPSADGGQTAAGQGATVLDRSENTPVKNVVTHNEQAMDPKVAPAVRLGSGPVDAPHERPLTEPQPKKVKTVSVRPDGTVIENEPVPPAVAKATSAGAQTPAVKNGVTPNSPIKPATTPAADKPAQAKAKPKPVVKPAPKDIADLSADDAAPADDAPAAAAPVGAGGFAVQFGAAGSEAEARALISQIATKYGSQLGGRKPTFRIAKVADKTVYRVRVGGVSKESAASICTKVKSSGGNCFVAAN